MRLRRSWRAEILTPWEANSEASGGLPQVAGVQTDGGGAGGRGDSSVSFWCESLCSMLARLHGSGDISKELQMKKREENTVRVTNLSEDASEEDLAALFGQVGPIERVFLAKHK